MLLCRHLLETVRSYVSYDRARLSYVSEYDGATVGLVVDRVESPQMVYSLGRLTAGIYLGRRAEIKPIVA